MTGACRQADASGVPSSAAKLEVTIPPSSAAGLATRDHTNIAVPDIHYDPELSPADDLLIDLLRVQKAVLARAGARTKEELEKGCPTWARRPSH